MRSHGSESFYVLGEGLLGETVGGRQSRLVDAGAEAPPFRFSRMGPSGTDRQLTEAVRKRVADEMTAGGGGASRIPAGYTYLGQFLDHDLTFDKTDVTFGDHVAPSELLLARSPRLDLDSLYGAGPQDAASERFYAADGIHLKMGRTVAVGDDAAMDGFDLPRGAGSTTAQKRRAIIPDPRNDENLAVAQTHLAFVRFHNRVVDTLPASVPESLRFAKAREIVTKHYQWMIRSDYLHRICAAGVVNDVFKNGRKAFEPDPPATAVPTMPIEFAVGAFRLGHSMVRDAYNWNARFDDGSGTLDLLFEFTATSGQLGGSPRLPSNWIADFRRLYDFGEADRPGLVVPADKFNRAMRIDTRLADPLRTIPSFPRNEANLAFRNLTRARMVRLATGQQMATFLKGKGVTLTKLTKAQIRDGNKGATLDGFTQGQREAFLQNTPLWFYVLREAELNRGRLNGVGARIVAETFHRAIEGSKISIFTDPTWRPTLGPDSTTFRMVDLLLFAFQGKKSLLAPLG
ncbi:MAG TPA: heme peroxidase family protein [Nocardioidaceae bacterium]|nr:heme peroxidase family protein [Nocardioidaceae bacterium]